MQAKKQKEKTEEEKLDAVMIGLRIQQIRNKRGLTQEQLASLVGRNTNYIGNLENGRSSPSAELFVSLSKVLDVSIEYFLMDDPDIKPIYSLNPEMEKRSREMTLETRLTCIAMMDQLIEVQNRSLEAGRKERENIAHKKK